MRLLLGVMLMILTTSLLPAAEPVARPLLGAIRWDAWHGDQGTPGKAVQTALSPRQWHDRLPFFAKVLGDDAVAIDGTAQAVMDQEIAYAEAAGIDYWAFVTYADGDAMSLGMARYLSSTKAARLKFCLVTECNRWANPAFIERVTTLISDPRYLTVLHGRPVLFLGFIYAQKVKEKWKDAAGLKIVIDQVKATVRKTRGVDPYLVIMDFNPQRGKEWLDALGGEALCSYAITSSAKGGTYQALTDQAGRFWTDCAATGAQVVPICTAGWDRRPRIAYPMPWETWQKPGAGIEVFTEKATPAQLAAHVRDGLDWIDAHPASAPARLALLYAWNENDEGGWIVPTLADGTARLDAIGAMLKAWTPRQPK